MPFMPICNRGIPIARQLQKENWPAHGFNLKDPSGNDVHIEELI